MVTRDRCNNCRDDEPTTTTDDMKWGADITIHPDRHECMQIHPYCTYMLIYIDIMCIFWLAHASPLIRDITLDQM